MTVYHKHVHRHNNLTTTNMVAQSENVHSISETFIVIGICTTANYEGKLRNFKIID